MTGQVLPYIFLKDNFKSRTCLCVVGYAVDESKPSKVTLNLMKRWPGFQSFLLIKRRYLRAADTGVSHVSHSTVSVTVLKEDAENNKVRSG